MESARKERYGIGKRGSKNGQTPDTEKYGRGKRTKGLSVDYQKLNEGLDDIEETPPSPKKTKHTPVRSGPTPHRQSAQKQKTENPLVRTLSTVKSKKDTEKESTQTAPIALLIGVPPTVPIESTSLASTLVGVPPTVSEETTPSTSGLGARDVFLGVPELDNLLLPDLGLSKEPTREDVLNQTINNEPSQELPPEVNTTEDELDTADALLSLSNTRDIGPTLNDDLGIEDNALLVPIGGQAVCEDIAPTASRLGQIEVDSEIARIIDAEEHTVHSTPQASTPLLGVQDPSVAEQNRDNIGAETAHSIPPTSTPLLGVQDPSVAEQNRDSIGAETVNDTVDTSTSVGKESVTDTLSSLANPSGSGARPKSEGTKTGARPKSEGTKTGTRGAFKSQLFGLRRKVPKDRAYKCQVCGKSKRSMEALNEHQRARHNPQSCGVCGKVFDLATSLAHHMYSHYTRKYYCEKCDYHCFFPSELESHKIVHREQPSYQCQYPKCGKWFKRKGELSLHVEIHDKTWYDCKKCDFSTKLVKYLKEHEKSHLKKDEKLPYECKICSERFLWRSGLKRHREKKHSG